MGILSRRNNICKNNKVREITMYLRSLKYFEIEVKIKRVIDGKD